MHTWLNFPWNIVSICHHNKTKSYFALLIYDLYGIVHTLCITSNIRFYWYPISAQQKSKIYEVMINAIRKNWFTFGQTIWRIYLVFILILLYYIPIYILYIPYTYVFILGCIILILPQSLRYFVSDSALLQLPVKLRWWKNSNLNNQKSWYSQKDMIFLYVVKQVSM